MLRRETIIALRARHTAFRIASDILHPPQPPPPLPQPAIPVIDEGELLPWPRRVRQRHERLAALLALLMVLAVLCLLVVAFGDDGQQPPPPPQARPISPAP